jgi:hypothetical protein
VNFLLNGCRAKFFFGDTLPDFICLGTVQEFSYPASLDIRPSERTIHAAPNKTESQRTHPVNTAVHRFEELIAGRQYQIEVAEVARDRWRAYIVRIPGVPTALMPFYGPTPDEAAHHLRTWLTRAHERAAGAVRAVK